MAQPRDLLDQNSPDVPFVVSVLPGNSFAALRDSAKLYLGTDGDADVSYNPSDDVVEWNGKRNRFDAGAKLPDNQSLQLGSDADGTLQFNTTRRALTLDRPGVFLDLDGADCSDRLTLVEKFLHTPQLNNDLDTFTASVAAAEMVKAMTANKDFELSGTNAVNSVVAFGADGGIVLTSTTADGDEIIIGPQTSTGQSVWNGVAFKPNAASRFECLIKSGSNITNAIIWAGLKLTGAEAVGTDDDQVYFRYEDDVNSGKWSVRTSIGGTDATADSGVTVAVSTVYHLVIDIQSDRTAKCYINGTLVATTGALTAAALLKPWVGVAVDGGTGAKVLTVYWLKCSRNYA